MARQSDGEPDSLLSTVRGGASGRGLGESTWLRERERRDRDEKVTPEQKIGALQRCDTRPRDLSQVVSQHLSHHRTA